MKDLNTPWIAKKDNPFDVEFVDKQGKELFRMLDGEISEFVLKAVNYHDKLVEMVNKLLPYASYTGTERAEAEQLLTELKKDRNE